MALHKACRRCTASFPPSSFVGARGGQVQSCADCRAQLRRGNSPPGLSSARTSPPRLGASPPPSVLTPSPSRRSTPSPGSTPRSGQRSASPHQVPATTEAAIEECIISRLDSILDQRLGHLLARFDTTPPPPAPLLAEQPAPTIAPSPLPPGLATAPTPSATESPLASIHRCFPWVSADVVDLVAQDKLKPEHLSKLCNPVSCTAHMAPKTKNMVYEDGQLAVTEEDEAQHSSAFLKAVPNITTLAHIWTVYMTIRVFASGNLALLAGLQKHLLHLIEYDGLYTWLGVVNYHLKVCCFCFGSVIALEWAQPDQEAHSSVLSPHHKTVGTDSFSSSSSQQCDQGAGPSK